MGILIPSYSRRILRLLGATLALCVGLTGLAHADEAAAPQAAGAPYAAPLAKLQVTGSAEKFSIDADHADVQSVLKALFVQADAQFTTDNNVVGQVTMHLTNQSLLTTLDAVCKQLLIHFKKDDHGIYVFEQDTQAVASAIARVKELNALMRQQLRAMGVSVPEDGLLNNAQAGPAGEVNTPQNGAASRNFGSQGGATGLRGGGGRGGAAAPAGADATKGLQNRAAGDAQRSAAKADKSQTAPITDLKYLDALSLEEVFGINPQNNALQNPDLYRQFQKQSGNVFINTGGQKVPVVDVLQELGRQSNTRILIDASVPSGPKFSLNGYITPRPLPDALNVLAQYSRLTWHWFGANVIVEALPDFQLFYNSSIPRVIVNGTITPLQQNAAPGQQNNNSNNSNGSTYAQPNQTPLPITNGQKKTP